MEYWSRTPKVTYPPGSRLLLHQLTRLHPENSSTGRSWACICCMCLSAVEISPLWCCLTWVHELYFYRGTTCSLLSLSLFFCLSHQPVQLKCADKHEVETHEICLKYEPQHLWGLTWGFFPPSTPISSSQQIKSSFPIKASSMQIWNLPTWVSA